MHQPTVKVALAILELLVHTLAIVFGVIEVGRRLVPGPALIYTRQTDTDVPGATTVITTFANPNSDWPLLDFTAAWTLSRSDIKFTSDAAGPNLDTLSPIPNLQVRATEAIPTLATFHTYLHADNLFTVVKFHTAAFIAVTTVTGIERQKVDVFDSELWSAHLHRSERQVGAILLVALAALFGVNRLFALVRSKV